MKPSTTEIILALYFPVMGGLYALAYFCVYGHWPAWN